VAQLTPAERERLAALLRAGGEPGEGQAGHTVVDSPATSTPDTNALCCIQDGAGCVRVGKRPFGPSRPWRTRLT
jgi:hypothetical protein